MLIAIEARDIRIDMVLAISCMRCCIMRYLECTVSGCPSYTSIPDTARQVSLLDCYYSVTSNSTIDDTERKKSKTYLEKE